ncbi:MAG: hypothetical protein AAF678_09215 [Pseudomonadota bacterium]
MTGAGLVLYLAGWWLTAGAAVAALFLTIGIDRIDEDARDAYAFRPLLIPAILLIWPLVLWRWLKLESASDAWISRYQPPRAVHLPVAILLAVAIGFAVIAGLSVRQSWPGHIPAERLSEIEQ